MRTEEDLRRRLKRAALVSLGAGALGAMACLAGAAWDPVQAARSWLWAFLFWAGLAVGCAGAAWLHQMLGGGWGAVVRRLLESGAATAP
ncbi:MAG TPA: hypothetical protein VEJ18_00475, partial [Planctomycetota bacterium]|nr:hypothetical protein [Planctomycetota bacterium]